MIVTALVAALVTGQAALAAGAESSIQPVQYYGVPRHPPPCGDGWDVSARDGWCYPNGYLPPQEQQALQGYYYRRGRGYGYGRHPVPCGNGADIDIRDGRCYPNGTVPPRFQQGLQYYRY